MATDPERPPVAYKTGRVDTLEEIRGLCEWRFVPTGWVDPMAHHMWCIVKDPTVIEAWRERLKECPPQVWYRHGVVAYTAQVSYDETVRPVLVKIGGFV